MRPSWSETAPLQLGRPRAIVAGLLLSLGSAALGDDATRTEDVSPPGVRAAAGRGLDWLAAHQDEHVGSFGRRYKVASTGLAGLAALAAGGGYQRGRYGVFIESAVRYLLDVAITHPAPHQALFKDNAPDGKMHAHGIATLFLAEVYGSAPKTVNDKIREALRDAVAASLDAQTRKGGWGYYLRTDGEYCDEDEASVTITQIQALRAARDAGIYVPAEAIARAVGYVKESMTSDGACRYSLTMTGREHSRTSFELTAAAVATLNSSGVYLGEGEAGANELERGLKYLRAKLKEVPAPAQAASAFYFYGNFYAAQAMYQATPEDWGFWFPSVAQELLSKQEPDGHWKTDRNLGEEYATASAVLILEIPRRYLPILQK